MDILFEKGARKMNEVMMEEIKGVRINLCGVYRLVFGKDFEGEEDFDVVEMALVIRNHLKGRFDVSPYIRKRFNLVLSQMGCVDYKLSEAFYQQCV
jgi:hypothetical protein